MKSRSHSKSRHRHDSKELRKTHRKSSSSEHSSHHASSSSKHRRRWSNKGEKLRHRKSSSSSHSRSHSQVKKKIEKEKKLTASDLKEKTKKALDRAENQDVVLKEVKENKVRQVAVKNIQLASNPDDPLARANIIEAIKSDAFSQSSFISGTSKLTGLNDKDRHEDAIFGSGAAKSNSKSGSARFDLSSIQLPSERPKNATSAITDPKMLIHKRFHVSKDEKAIAWMKYYETLYLTLISVP